MIVEKVVLYIFASFDPTVTPPKFTTGMSCLLRTLDTGSELGTLRLLATGSELGTIRTLATAMGFKFFLLLSVSKIGGVQTGCHGPMPSRIILSRVQAGRWSPMTASKPAKKTSAGKDPGRNTSPGLHRAITGPLS